MPSSVLTARRAGALAAVTAALLLLYYLRPVLNPFLLAMALAYVLNPLVCALEKRRVPRKAAIGLIFFSLIIAIVIALLVLVPATYREACHWKTEVIGENYTYTDSDNNGRFDPETDPYTFDDENQNGKLDQGYTVSLHSWMESQNILRDWLGKIVPEDKIDPLLKKLGDSLKGQMRAAISGIGLVAAAAWSGSMKGAGWLFSLLLLLLLTPIYFAFLLNSLDSIWNTSVKYLPGGTKGKTVEILKKIDLVLSAFFRGRLLVCVAIGVFTALGFWIIGVPFGLFFGLLIGAMSFIPFLNNLGLLVALLSCLMNGFTFWQYAAVLGVFGVGQLLDPLLTSLVLGKDLQLHPVTIILSMFVCSYLLGFFGMLLAVPIVATLKILGKEFVLPLLESFSGREAETPSEPPRLTCQGSPPHDSV
jgi:predicted PurR-regulated permease PerM